MNEVLVPQVAKTGEVAQFTASTRISKSARATLNVRLTFPQTKLVVRTNGEEAEVEHADEGEAYFQFQMGLN